MVSNLLIYRIHLGKVINAAEKYLCVLQKKNQSEYNLDYSVILLLIV